MYKVITCHINEAEQEIPIALLADLVESFEQQATKLLVYFQEDATTQKDIETILKRLHIDYEMVILEADKNWNEEWEKNFDPVYIDDFIQIRASWHPVSTKTKHHFLLSPKMAFGTGHHATTYMMLERMAVRAPKGKRILDLGCGTGILGVMAKKLGASYVSMVDIEQPAVENSLEHAQLNEVKVDQVLLGTLQDIEPQPFDIIYANIQKEVILPLLAPLHQYVHANSYVQFSGIMLHQIDAVKTAIKAANWKIVFDKTMGDWALIEVCPNS